MVLEVRAQFVVDISLMSSTQVIITMEAQWSPDVVRGREKVIDMSVVSSQEIQVDANVEDRIAERMKHWLESRVKCRTDEKDRRGSPHFRMTGMQLNQKPEQRYAKRRDTDAERKEDIWHLSLAHREPETMHCAVGLKLLKRKKDQPN